MGRLPLIAVTTSEVRKAEQFEPIPEGEPARPEMALGMRYLQAIESAGGLPVVIPPLAGEGHGGAHRQGFGRLPLGRP